MEGSGSGSGSGSDKRGGEGLPPTAPRSSRRRPREDNSNEQNPEMSVEPNLQPQPQQIEAGGETEPVDQRAREANRRYSETFRHRRQSHIQHLEAVVQSLEAQVAQNKAECERLTIESSQDHTKIEALRSRREASSADLAAKEAETARIKEKIEKLERLMEANDQEMLNLIMNDPDFQFFEETFRAVIEALTRQFPNDPPCSPAPGGDEAGPSGTQDSTSSSDDDSV